MVPYQKRLLAPLIQRQCSSVIYLGKKIVPINNGQMLRATSLTVWANELHSSLINGNILGLGNLDFFSKLWGKSTCVATYVLVLAHRTLFPISESSPFLRGSEKTFHWPGDVCWVWWQETKDFGTKNSYEITVISFYYGGLLFWYLWVSIFHVNTFVLHFI